MIDTMTSTTIQIPYGYEPRGYQLPILQAFDNGITRALWVVHRRGGKDLTIWNLCIKEAVTKKQIIYYFLPTFSQAKRVIWQGMTKDGWSFLDCIPEDLIKRKSESELSITFKNGSIIQLIGSESYDRIVGTAPKLVVFSEAALMPKEAWSFIRPILTENGGKAIFISTPRGKNWFYDLFVAAKQNPKWFCESLTVEDTKSITLVDIDEERKMGMSEELIQQEFYVSFSMGIDGSYYGRLLDKARLEARIGRVYHEHNALVHTAWDIGYGDATSIVFFQIIGNEIHIIDCYENHNEGLFHYASILQQKAFELHYNYGTHFFPHDVKNGELGTGITRFDTLLGLGITPHVLETLRISPANGIDVVRGLFPRMWINEKSCARLIKALENYRKEYDSARDIYSERPVHDWSSHYADAIRYMGIAYKTSMGVSSMLTTEDIYMKNKRMRRNI